MEFAVKLETMKLSYKKIREHSYRKRDTGFNLEEGS